MRLRAAPQHLAGLVCYAVLTVVLTWPVIRDLSRVAPNDLGDPLLSTFILWWNAHVVPFTGRWWDGPFFFPAPDTLTYSDHRVGIGVITTPAIWLGLPPLAAQNLAFVLSFFLSAVAAYALGFVLTGSRSAAFIAGLIFGFNPYRADHLSHLELLASYWLPVVMLALHRWIATLQLRWLALTTTAVVMLGLTSGYYFVFAGVLLAVWLPWFLRGGVPIAAYAWTFAALLLAAAVVAPIFLVYREAHEALDLRRGVAEIEYYSADLIALVTAPERLVLWNTPSSWYRPEGALFPGLTAVLVVAVSWWTRERQTPTALAGWARHGRRLALALGAIMVVVALVPRLLGPVSQDIGGLKVSVSDSHKPVSVAVVFLTIWMLSSGTIRSAWQSRSPLTFYVLATLLMWVCALGPAPRMLGELILYKPPYAWLMELPGFGGGLRVPARFGMLAVLTLSAAASLAFSHIVRGRARVRRAALIVATAAIVAESWFELKAPVAPPPLDVPRELTADAAILELPIDIASDATAMYHAIEHRRPIVNGMSGHDAPHYGVLRAAWEEGDLDAFRPLARYAPIGFFIPRALPSELGQRLAAALPVAPVASTPTHDVFLMPREERTPLAADTRQSLPIVSIHDAISNAADLPNILDDDRDSVWMTDEAQAGTEFLTLDLGTPALVSGVRLAQGAGRLQYPREVAVEASLDSVAWRETSRLAVARPLVEAILRDPRDATFTVDFAPTQVRYVRIRQLGTSKLPWAVAKVEVLAAQ